MTESPRHDEKPSRTTKTPPTISPVMLIFGTALDTTWRIFAPTLGGVFLGIWLDSVFSIAPVATIACLIAGVVTSGILIARQLKTVRKTSN